MQANRWFVEHVEHARGAVSHRTRKLDALALACGQGGARSVQREVSQSQVKQPARAAKNGVADALRHGAHVLWQGGGYAADPVAQLP